MAVFNVAREEGTRPDTFFYHIEDGLQYHVSDERICVKYFKCVYYERGCRGRAVLDDLNGFRHTNAHNHERDLDYPEEMFVRRRILQRCRALEYVSFSVIVDEELVGASQEVRSRIFVGRMRTSMRNARMDNYPFVPHDLRQLTLLLMKPQYRVITMTEDGEGNIYGGSVTDRDGAHHILFVSERMVGVARNLRTLHGDGTFKVTPAGLNIEQVFCIVGSWRNHNILVALAFMENRSQNAYEAVLQLFQHHLGPNIHLSKVITDFEVGQQNAWALIFAVRVQGCLWHACRRFLLTAQEIGLTVLMREIPEVRRIVRLCMALPLLPRNYMPLGLVIIRREARDEGNYINQIVQPFLQYIWTSWIRSERTCSRLSVYGSEARTNNTCESQNKELNKAAGRHPTTYGFMAAAVKLEQKAHDMVVALNAGRRVGRGRRRTSIINDERIRELSLDLVNPPGPLEQAILRFLRSASMVMANMIDEALR